MSKKLYRIFTQYHGSAGMWLWSINLRLWWSINHSHLTEVGVWVVCTLIPRPQQYCFFHQELIHYHVWGGSLQVSKQRVSRKEVRMKTWFNRLCQSIWIKPWGVWCQALCFQQIETQYNLKKKKGSWCNTVPGAQGSIIIFKLNSRYMPFLSRKWVKGLQ